MVVVEGRQWDIPDATVVPWLFGLSRSLTTRVVGSGALTATVGAPTEGQRGRPRYLVSLPNRESGELSESWVVPWVAGLAASHGLTLPPPIGNPSTRSSCYQALMEAHQRGWVEYSGLSERTEDDADRSG